MRQDAFITGGAAARARVAGRGSARRATVLVAVLIVVVMAALIGTAMVMAAGVRVESSVAALRRAQSRAAAWSGVQAVMAQLSSQRDLLLDGETPEVDAEFEIFKSEEGVRGIARLAALESWEDLSGAQVTIVSEAAKLDVNVATGEMLSKLPGMTQKLAKSIVDARGSGGFASIEELLRVPGMSASMLYGAAPGASDRLGASVGGVEPVAPGVGGGTPATAHLPLAAYLTTFSFDPNVQAGIGEDGSEYKGKLRICLASGWSSEMEDGIRSRFGDEAAKAAKGIFEGGKTFTALSQFVGLLRQLRVPIQEWSRLVDAFTTTLDEYLVGRVDLSVAPAEVLACIPGVPPEAAGEIVRMREQLDEAQRRDVTWPLQRGILDQDQFEKAVDYLTTRSMQYRVRVEAGTASGYDPGPTVGTDEGRMTRVDGNQAGPEVRARAASTLDASPREQSSLRYAVRLEAVIDVSSQRPHVAYLRDVTLLDAARLVRERLEQAMPETPPEVEERPEPAESPEGLTSPAPLPEGFGSDLDMERGLDLDPLELDSMDRRASTRRPSLDLGGGLDLGSGLDLGNGLELGPRGERPSPAASRISVPPTSRTASGGEEAPEAGGGVSTSGDGGATPARQGQDRRIGRWNTQKPGSGSSGEGSGSGGSEP